MKINQPVTNKEQTIKDGSILCSRTDVKGIITFANKTFVEISGFSMQELVGRSHNIVRHPDMPPETFQDLWETVKQGKPWFGLVKNRCKNGDFYWVKTTVSPVMNKDHIVEYMSVRSKPSRQQVVEAEALYRDIKSKKAELNKGKMARWIRMVSNITAFMPVNLTVTVMSLCASADSVLSLFMDVSNTIKKDELAEM